MACRSTCGRGEVVGLVGESGSGKTTLGRSVLRLVEPTGGYGAASTARMSPALDRAGHEGAAQSQMQIIFQDPYASLNPRMSVGQIIGEALLLHDIGTRKDRTQRVGDLLEKVGLPRIGRGALPA